MKQSDIYTEALTCLRSILLADHPEFQNWIDWLERDIQDWNTDVVVIVDEAYVDFADGPSARTLIEKYPNLLVVQTFSKSRSMAGMRIGYAMGNKELIKALNDVKYSFNSYTMSSVALLCGVEAVNDKAYFEEHVKKICETREKTKKALAAFSFSLDRKSTRLNSSHNVASRMPSSA